MKNGPAFPELGQITNRPDWQTESGLTKLEWYAGKAMQGICAHPDTWGESIEGIVVKAFDIAGAMLAESERRHARND